MRWCWPTRRTAATAAPVAELEPAGGEDGARFLVQNPERGRPICSHWSDPKHRNAKPPEWLADMRERIERAKGER